MDDLEKQRTSTIEKLKAATKYNTTQELLKKYGGTPTPKTQTTSSPKQAKTSSPGSGRTNMAPPPTANIPGRTVPASLPNTPQRPAPETRSPLSQNVPRSASTTAPPWQQPSSPGDTSAEFAPNAFPTAPQYAQAGEGPRWYDRLVDALLGEDETAPRNRIALICSQCRLVNGQAPPGVKRLEDIGKWRCGGCGTMNGEESEAKKLVASIEREVASVNQESDVSTAKDTAYENIASEDAHKRSDGSSESDVTQYTDESGAEEEIEKEMQPVPKPVVDADTPRRRSTRKKADGKKT